MTCASVIRLSYTTFTVLSGTFTFTRETPLIEVISLVTVSLQYLQIISSTTSVVSPMSSPPDHQLLFKQALHPYYKNLYLLLYNKFLEPDKSNLLRRIAKYIIPVQAGSYPVSLIAALIFSVSVFPSSNSTTACLFSRLTSTFFTPCTPSIAFLTLITQCPQDMPSTFTVS